MTIRQSKGLIAALFSIGLCMPEDKPFEAYSVSVQFVVLMFFAVALLFVVRALFEREPR